MSGLDATRLAAICALAMTGCFNPTYNNPSCGPAGECPSGLVCSAGTCVSSINGGGDGGGGDGARDSSTTVDSQLVTADGGCSDTVVAGKFTVVGCNHLVTARSLHTATLHPNGLWVYVIGGSDAAGAPLASIERAPVNADGTLGQFVALPVTLETPRTAFSTSVYQNFIYVIGGRTSSAVLPTIERATMNADGSLSAFTTLSQMMNTPRQLHASVVAGEFLYVISGTQTVSPAGAPVPLVASTSLNGDGSIGTFTNKGATLMMARSMFASFANTTGVFAIGGATPTDIASVEVAGIDGTGDMVSSFANAGALRAPRAAFASSIIASTSLYVVMGGVNGSNFLSTVEDVPTNSGNLDFGPLTITLSQPRAYSASIATTNRVYVIGGLVGPGATSTTTDTLETATMTQLQ